MDAVQTEAVEAYQVKPPEALIDKTQPSRKRVPPARNLATSGGRR